ncbi:uncharacterized protein LOC141816286, partial [Curcuma longa]|uniref:uncharacterized protein LOC141816286 n=1 Tax=Curcuma longa TaxID=136217 RepID=UPI003D9ED17C
MPMGCVAVDSLPLPAATFRFHCCSWRLPTATITTLPFSYFRVTSRSLDWIRRARVFVSAMSNEIVPMSTPLEVPATSKNIERVGSVKQQLSRLVKESLESFYSQMKFSPLLRLAKESS